MYESLLKINMLLTEFNVDKKIVVDNEENSVLYGDKKKVVSKEEFVSFLDNFFRVLRSKIIEPKNKGVSLNSDYLLRIRVVEKENSYDYAFRGNSLNEFDEFYDILSWLRK